MQLAICVDTTCALGPLIERALLTNELPVYHSDEFEVNPIKEDLPFAEEPLADLVQRAVGYAKKMKRLHPDWLPVGVTSGLVTYAGSCGEGLVRLDIATFLEKNTKGEILYWRLNHKDVYWQVQSGLVRRKGNPDSVEILCRLIEEAYEDASVLKS